MKPNKKIIYIIFLLILFIGDCKKDATDSNATVGYLKGVVIHIYKKTPIPGLAIQIEEERPGIFGPDRTLWDKSTTNGNGEFTLKLQKTDADYSYVVSTSLPIPFDTTKITSKFMPVEIYLSAGKLTNPLNIELEPSGYISVYLADSTWNNIPADSVIVSSPYDSGYLIHRKQGNVYFNVDPCQLNQFRWNYIKNGLNGNIITKQVYVPNYYKGDSGSAVLFYELKY